jgi:transcriptional regulator with XRE-family HTH domain
MVYNVKDKRFIIGERIRQQRLEAGYKRQCDFAEALGLRYESRQTVGAWEQGKRLPQLHILLKMCELFDCEIGYLLCEYDCKTREVTDISAATGLSEQSIKRLFLFRTKKRDGKKERFEFNSPINSIIEHPAFVELIDAIKKHVWSFNHHHYGIDNSNAETQEALSNTFNCEPEELRGYIEMSSQSLIENTIMKIVRDIE